MADTYNFNYEYFIRRVFFQNFLDEKDEAMQSLDGITVNSENIRNDDKEKLINSINKTKTKNYFDQKIDKTKNYFNQKKQNLKAKIKNIPNNLANRANKHAEKFNKPQANPGVPADHARREALQDQAPLQTDRLRPAVLCHA